MSPSIQEGRAVGLSCDVTRASEGDRFGRFWERVHVENSGHLRGIGKAF